MFSKSARAVVGQLAPAFKGGAYHNGLTEVSLKDYKDKYVVLFFYPLDFTFVCPTEIVEFSKRVGEFEKVGT
jgi:alkyl hydroperoxide reductase subunit AhpC